jgi:carbonic anhydrase
MEETRMRELQPQMTPDEILEKFKIGNRRFLDGTPKFRDALTDVKRTALGQTPHAIVLGCIDSRKPAEVIFDKGLGDIFNARVAGNFVNTDILGSIEFACKVSGSRLILVMGHSDCGAVKAAVDDVRLGNITPMLANLKPAVASVTESRGRATSEDNAFVAAVARENVLLNMKKIPHDSPIIAEMVDKGEVRIVGCMYDLASGVVEFYG